MSKIRILRILNRFNLGGPTYNASLLTKYLEPEFETMLIGGPNEKDEIDSMHIPHSLGIEPIIVDSLHRSINPILDNKALGDIKKIIKEFNPHIVHTHASKAGAIGRSAAISTNVPVIVHTYHGHVFEAYFNGVVNSFYKMIERKLAKKTDAIIALSESQRNDLVEKYKVCKAAQTHIIQNGFDLSNFQKDMTEKRSKFRKYYNIAEDEFAIGIIGRMVPIKNHAMFVNVVARVSELYSGNVRYFIVGDGETFEQTKQMLIDKNISFSIDDNKKATIQFTSWQKNIDSIMAGLDIVALTSLNEGTPVCLVEAQVAQCPIVSTNVGGIKDIVLEGKTALLSPTQDVEAMSQNILKLIQNKEFYDSMKYNHWDRIKDNFQYNRMLSDMKNLYFSLLEKNKISKHKKEVCI